MGEHGGEGAQESGTVVITGASRGIGAATARLAAARGFAVAVNYSTGEAEAAAVVTAIREQGGKAVAICANVGRESDILQLFRQAELELGPIRGLVNNAGVTGGFARVEAVTAEALERTFAVNVTGAIFNSLRLLANHPTLAGKLTELIRALRQEGGLARTQTELVWTTSAAVNGCHY